MPVYETEVETVLFDMDGVGTLCEWPLIGQTLIDSTPAVNATWQEFAEKYRLDLDEVVRARQG